jgi:hypothetical protein
MDICLHAPPKPYPPTATGPVVCPPHPSFVTPRGQQTPASVAASLPASFDSPLVPHATTMTATTMMAARMR